MLLCTRLAPLNTGRVRADVSEPTCGELKIPNLASHSRLEPCGSSLRGKCELGCRHAAAANYKETDMAQELDAHPRQSSVYVPSL